MSKSTPTKTTLVPFVRVGTWEHVCEKCCEKHGIPHKKEYVVQPGTRIVTNTILTCSKCEQALVK